MGTNQFREGDDMKHNHRQINRRVQAARERAIIRYVYLRPPVR